VNGSSTPAATGVCGSTGYCTAPVTIPSDSPQGPLFISVVDQSTGAVGTAQFQVTDLQITPASGTDNTTFTIFGVNYGLGETVDFYLNSFFFDSTQADGNGDFSLSFPPPSFALPGANTVTATGETSLTIPAASRANAISRKAPKRMFSLIAS
jgi:hypothetical protein